MIVYERDGITLWRGDVLATLARLPADSVDCVVTSPPYWSLRKYSGEGSVWGGDADCEHEWADVAKNGATLEGYAGTKKWQHSVNGRGEDHPEARNRRDNPDDWTRITRASDLCRCGAWRGQYGLEPTPELYVEHSLIVLRAIWRVLKPTGVVFWNIGDSYAGSWGNYSGGKRGNGSQRTITNGSQAPNPAYDGLEDWRPPGASILGLKPKDLVLIPWRVGLAAQADGWVIRSDVIWSKSNPMPESVTDRPTKSHEYVLMMSKGRWVGTAQDQFDAISDEDARWLALLIDTEGNIGVRRQLGIRNGYGMHSAQVAVGNTSRALVECARAIAGVGAVLVRSGKNAPIYYWQPGGKEAAGLLRRIYPYLIVKQRQARCAIYLETLKWYRGGHGPLPADDIAKRERLWVAVKSLNHFGDPDIADIPEPSYGRWTSQPYFFDADAVREPFTDSTIQRITQESVDSREGGYKQEQYAMDLPGRKRRDRKPAEIIRAMAKSHRNRDNFRGGTDDPLLAHKGFKDVFPNDGGRNIRTVWTIPTQPSPLPHFASFPEALAERCIKAGCPADGVVLDPFGGTGTTLKVARDLGRRAIGIEISAEYCELARQRLDYGISGVQAIERGQMPLVEAT